MLSPIYISESSFSKNFSKFEFLEKGKLFLFIEYFGSFRLFYGDISVGRGKRLEIIVVIPGISDVLIDLKRRNLNVLLVNFKSWGYSFCSVLLVLSWGNRDILDDGDVQSGLTLCVLVHLGFFEFIFMSLFSLVVLKLFGYGLEADL